MEPNKDPKPKKGDEIKDWEEIKENNQIIINEQNPSKDDQDIQNETELSEIETGSKGQDFDEMISFNHTFLNYRIARCFPTKEKLNEFTFALLLTNAFIYSGDAIDINYMENLSNSEAVKNVRDKINSYKDDDIQIKFTFLENIDYYAKTVGFQETAESILPLLSDLPKEREDLIERFFNDFKKFVDEVFKFGDKAYFILKDHMINLIEEILINKTNPKLLKQVSDGLVHMTKYMKEEDKGGCVLKIVIQMAQDDYELKKEIAISLFGRLAPLVGNVLTSSYIVPQIDFFSNDPQEKIRKAVVQQLKNICTNIDQAIFKKKLLPVYKALSSDAFWSVRKGAAEILPDITKLCDVESITKDLIPIFKNFTKDEKTQVKNIAIEIFGEFISLLGKIDKENLTELLDFYVNYIMELKKDSKSIIQKCAYNFPSVLQFFGAEAWPKLKSCFVKMANEKDEKIKMPLAAAMGEISKILGSELTENDLLEYVDKFFNSSQNSELKIKILASLPDIIKNINSNKKNSYLTFIKIMIGIKDDKWRKRVTYCKIIGKFNGTYTDNIIYKRVFPIAINFCFDDISSVRKISAKKNSRLILQLISGKEEYRDKTMKIIQSFAQSINFRYRQLFIYMCKHLFDNEEVFKTYISDLLLDLAYDNITNVRIVLAEFLNHLFKKKKYEHLKKNETIRKIVKILKNDKAEEVKSIMKDINDVEDIEVELKKEVNHKFKDLMKFVSSEFGITRNVPLSSKFVEKKPKKEETPGETPKVETPKGPSSQQIKEENKDDIKEKEQKNVEEKVEQKEKEKIEPKEEEKKEEKQEDKIEEKPEDKKDEKEEDKKEEKVEEKPEEKTE